MADRYISEKCQIADTVLFPVSFTLVDYYCKPAERKLNIIIILSYYEDQQLFTAEILSIFKNCYILCDWIFLKKKNQTTSV